ncbi:MAG TPA: amino acid adenylation domain-containing protein [Bacteroidia bacterium]|nr:amino acid adenylation domain-containing protein [Bacteroidia bacterium]
MKIPDSLLRFNSPLGDVSGFPGLADVFSIAAGNHPDVPALEWGNHSLTYRELDVESDRIASLLQQRGVKPGDLVGLCAERSADLPIAVLSIVKAGAAYVPFDPAYPRERIIYMIHQSGIRLAFVQPEWSGLFEGSGVELFFTNDAAKQSSGPQINSNPDNIAYVLFTSGSTGQPKGVAMKQRALMNLIQWQKNIPGLDVPARTLQFAPISFDVSFQELFTTWSTAGTLVMISDEMRLNAIRLLEFIRDTNIQRLFLPFIALQHLAEVAVNGKIYPHNLTQVITAGEQLQITPQIREFFSHMRGCRLHNHYGPTETHVVTAHTLPEHPGDWPALPPIGKPIDNTHAYLLDEDLQPVEIGAEGELWIAGEALAAGYINAPELTAERFVKNPFDVSGNSRLYKTGDLGRYLTNGDIEYLGRADTQVKVRGYRIELGEVEVALAASDGVSQVAVTVREDRPGNKRLIAYVVPVSGSKVTSSSLRSQLLMRLPEYMIPSAFVMMDTMPRTPSGKIDRRSLPKPDSSRPDNGVPYREPQSEAEKQLTSIWSDLLMIDTIGTEDNFFELGGNSLLALQSIAKMQQQYSVDIPVVKLYQFPSVRSLLAALNNDGATTGAVDAARNRKFGISASGHSRSVDDGIAVIGMAGRFPGADNIEIFWQNLKDGKESTGFFSSDQLDPSLEPAITNDPGYVKARGVLNDAGRFDAAFFGINPKLASLMDPQQRVFLEVCWEALENAGYSPGYKGLIGVYAGMGNNTYYFNNVLHHKAEIEKAGSFMVMVANEKDYIATRVSHFMNLKGPGLSIHTACSTSLTAVSLACRDLWDSRCDMAIAGGVAITSPVYSGHLYQEGGMFSSDGHTRPFDAAASGTVFSDGAGTVVLKRYRDAVRDGDTVYAIIRGVGVNNDGSDKASFTAPSVEGQAVAIAMAQADAGVTADSISYVEAHGTATPLGDPIEVEALTQAFGNITSDKQKCLLGSVKSNFGHLTAAAGVAGLIKTVLALHHKLIPGTLHFKQANPRINFAESPFYVSSENLEWNQSSNPRRAGVSSFGVGGTNVHVVLEEAPPQQLSGPSRSVCLLTLSAKNSERLSEAGSKLEVFLREHPSVNMADAAYTLQTGRMAFAHRRFVVAGNVVQAIDLLHTPNPGKTAAREIKSPSSGVAFMFPGQGSQYVKMGANLYRDEIVFREAVDRCAGLFGQHIGYDLRTVLYPAKGSEDTAGAELQKTSNTQPALFTIGYALSKLWMSWGIYPQALVGHSIGEFTAACISGVMSLEDAIMLVAHRGKMMQEQPGGSMLTVRISASELESELPESLSIAAINGPSLCVVSGNHDDIDSFALKMETKGIATKKLVTSHAFHSPMMDPVVKPFRELAARVKLHSPTIPIVSTATAEWLTPEQATNPGYWSAHLRLPVRFAEAIKLIWTDHPSMFLLELGPRNTATALARMQASDPTKQFAAPSLADTSTDEAEWYSMMFAIGQLWLSGINIDWEAFYALEKRKHIALPTYPFEQKRFWVNPPLASSPATFHPYQPFVAEPSAADATSDTQPTHTMNIPPRKERIIAELKAVMEDASGIELTAAPADATFPELGMDSLFLTQAALTISKKYATKVTFRQLNEEYSTLNALAAYIDQQLPEEKQVSIPSSATAAPEIPFAAVMPQNAQQGSIEWFLMQQMQMMQTQLAMLRQTQPIQQPAQPPVQHHASQEEVVENEKADLDKPFGAIARIEKLASSELTPDQKKWLSGFTTEYNKRTAKSKAYTQDHRSHLADPRVVTGFKPTIKELIYQVVADRSKGCRIWDIDGNEYIDVLNGFGSNFLGYGSEIVMAACKAQLENGIELGPQHPLAGEVAKLICEFTGYDRAGFCNTGSEAVLGAMRIARTVTGRNLIVCFNGSYHGINDEVIVRGTKKLKSFPAAAGIMPEAVQNMLVLDYGTEESIDIIRNRADEIAAVMIEPIQSRRADFRPTEFIKEVRKITSESGCLLIFDEVITGFRLEPGGAQTYYGVHADVSTYGKVIGGGMPIGVIAGKKEFMDALDGGFWKFGDGSVPEVGVTYFAGTFVRHPLALAAAKAVLLHLKERGQELYDKLNGFTTMLVNEVNQHAKSKGVPFHLVSFGSLFKMKWDEEHPYGELIFLLLRHKGIHIYDGFPCFLTDAFTKQDILKVIAKFKESIDELQQAGFLTTAGQPATSNHINGSHAETPPVPGARLGKTPEGRSAWFVPDPDRPGKYKLVQ